MGDHEGFGTGAVQVTQGPVTIRTVDRGQMLTELDNLGVREVSRAGPLQHLVVTNYRSLARASQILVGGPEYGYGSTILSVWSGPREGCVSLILREDWDDFPADDGVRSDTQDLGPRAGRAGSSYNGT